MKKDAKHMINRKKARYDIPPHLIFDMIAKKYDEARERKELVRLLQRRDRYLRQKLQDTYRF